MNYLADAVFQTTIGTGTGSFTLVAQTGFREIAVALPDCVDGSNTFPYFVRHKTLNEWEKGYGYISAGLLVRDASAANSSGTPGPLSFSAGTKEISVYMPSDQLAKLFTLDVPTDNEINALADARITLQKGANSGLAPLDSGGKVPVGNLPSAVFGSLSYQGAWNASTNSPTLASGTGTKGYYYKVGVAGSTDIDGITDWKVGDMVAFNGTTWDKFDNTDQVISVAGKQGTVTLDKTDVGLANVDNTADAVKPVSAAQQAAIDAKMGLDFAKFGIAGWWALSEASTVTVTSGLIDSVSGNMGYGPTISQASAKPTYLAATGPDAACAVFSGAQKLSALGSTPIRSCEGRYELIAVMNGTPSSYGVLVSELSTTVGGSNQNYMASGTSAGEDQQRLKYSDSNIGFQNAIAESGAGLSHNGTKQIVRLSVVDGVMFCYINGAYQFGGFVFDNALCGTDDFHLGFGREFSTDKFYVGKLFEFVILRNDIYAEVMEGYLAYKHGLVSGLPANHPYKLREPRPSDSPIYSVPVKQSYKMGQTGDSLTGFAIYSVSTTESRSFVGAATWLCNFSGGLFRIPPGYSKGVPGERASQIRGRIRTDFDAINDIDVFTIQGGINNFANESEAGVAGEMMICAAYAASRRRWFTFFSTMTPAGALTDPNKQKLRRINKQWLAQDNRFQGRLKIIDLFPSVVDEPNNDGWLANMQSHYEATPAVGLHPAGYGGWQWGKTAWNVVKQFFTALPVDPTRGSFLQNAKLAGTAGTIGALATGTAPDNWTINGVNDTGFAGTATRVASRIGQAAIRLAFNVTDGTANDTMTIEQSRGQGGYFNAGDTIYAIAEIQVIGTPANITDQGLILSLTGTGLSPLVTASVANDSNKEIPETFTTGEKYYLVTPDILITAGTSITAKAQYYVRAKSNVAPASFTVNISMIDIKKR